MMRRYIAEGKISKVEKREDGWWISIQHSPLSFMIGYEEPPHKAGDDIKLILEVR